MDEDNDGLTILEVATKVMRWQPSQEVDMLVEKLKKAGITMARDLDYFKGHLMESKLNSQTSKPFSASDLVHIKAMC